MWSFIINKGASMLQSLMLIMLATLYFTSISVAQEKRIVSVYSGDSVLTDWDSSIRHNTVGADSVEIVHKVLSALYRSTNGDQWTINSGWNLDVAPTSMEDFNQWHGLNVINGRLVKIALRQNELTGSLPPELGTLVNLLRLNLNAN